MKLALAGEVVRRAERDLVVRRVEHHGAVQGVAHAVTVKVPPSGSLSLASTWAEVTVIGVLMAVANVSVHDGRRIVDRRVGDRHQAAVVLVAADDLVLERGVAGEVIVRIERDASRRR